MTTWNRGLNPFYLIVLVIAGLLFLSSCATVSPKVIDHNNKTLQWSGMEWFIKESPKRQGPGPNFFSSDKRSVWVDGDGNLHLSIRKEGDNWICSEIISKDFVSYGKYSLEIASKVDDLDPNAVLGFFTWRPRGGWHHNEIDIEFSKWGKSAGHNAQFVVQPYSNYDHMHRFDFQQLGDYTTHEFLWLPYTVFFRSYHGHHASRSDIPIIDSWHSKTARSPRAKKTQIRINFWLNDPNGPTDGKPLEVVLKRFNYQKVSDLN